MWTNGGRRLRVLRRGRARRACVLRHGLRGFRRKSTGRARLYGFHDIFDAKQNASEAHLIARKHHILAQGKRLTASQ